MRIRSITFLCTPSDDTQVHFRCDFCLNLTLHMCKLCVAVNSNRHSPHSFLLPYLYLPITLFQSILSLPETVTRHFLLLCHVLRIGQGYRLYINIKRANSYQKDVVSTFTSSIDTLFIYFRKHHKLICMCDKSDNDYYAMISNGIGNEILSGA